MRALSTRKSNEEVDSSDNKVIFLSGFWLASVVVAIISNFGHVAVVTPCAHLVDLLLWQSPMSQSGGPMKRSPPDFKRFWELLVVADSQDN